MTKGSHPKKTNKQYFSVLFMFGYFSERGGGRLPDSKHLRNLFAKFWKFFRKGGAYLIPKMVRKFVLLWLVHLEEGKKLGRMAKVPTL